jgi:hypothetical protein
MQSKRFNGTLYSVGDLLSGDKDCGCGIIYGFKHARTILVCWQLKGCEEVYIYHSAPLDEYDTGAAQSGIKKI